MQVWEPVSCNTCFWWVPYDLRAPFEAKGYGVVAEHLAAIAPVMKAQMMQEGSLMVSFYIIGRTLR